MAEQLVAKAVLGNMNPMGDTKQKSNKTMEKLNNANWKAAKEEAAYQAEMDKLRRKGSQDKRTSESEKRQAEMRAKYGLKEPERPPPEPEPEDEPPMPPPQPPAKTGAKSKAMCAGMGCSIM